MSSILQPTLPWCIITEVSRFQIFDFKIFSHMVLEVGKLEVIMLVSAIKPQLVRLSHSLCSADHPCHSFVATSSASEPRCP
jgi:hypothetical protein